MSDITNICDWNIATAHYIKNFIEWVKVKNKVCWGEILLNQCIEPALGFLWRLKLRQPSAPFGPTASWNAKRTRRTAFLKICKIFFGKMTKLPWKFEFDILIIGLYFIFSNCIKCLMTYRLRDSRLLSNAKVETYLIKLKDQKSHTFK